LRPQRRQFRVDRCLLARQAGHRGLGARDQGTGLARITQQLALPLQVGSGAGHGIRQTEATRQVVRPDRCLPRLAQGRRELLFGRANGALALGQALNLPAPGGHPCGPCREDDLGQRQAPLGTPHGRRLLQGVEILASAILQRAPAAAFLRSAVRDALLQAIQPLLLAPVLRLQRLDGLDAGLVGGNTLALQLRAARFGASRLVLLGQQLRLLLSHDFKGCLRRLSLREAPGHAFPGSLQSAPLVRNAERLFVHAGRLLSHGAEAGLEQARCLCRPQSLRPYRFLPQQVGQQGLDLAVAVGAQLPLALRREHGGEERVGTAADGLDTAGVGVHLAV
jgi:hypothetical protein